MCVICSKLHHNYLNIDIGKSDGHKCVCITSRA